MTLPAQGESAQRQDSLTAQMDTLRRLAVKNGCYDAADWITRRFFPDDTCECGCGEPRSPGKRFLPGHQRRRRP